MRTKAPIFIKDKNPRLFVELFANHIRLEATDTYQAALAFKNAIHDDVALLGLTRLPQRIQGNFEQIVMEFLKLNELNSGEFYKKTLTEALKQQSNEDVRMYYRRFIQKVDQNRQEEETVAEFCRGLKGVFKIHINTA
jgi:hypothetical protein